ncbi:ABC transporter permease [Brachybacterium tyrofermentans]|uniref:ABC transporter permease n=1 Tax=Brachybacterium tyrofermentans TaxID=47848 RepID=UPI003FCF2BF9
MGGLIARRLGQAALVLWGALTIIFVVVRMVPGDPAALLLGPTATADQIAALSADLGYDDPMIVQYLKFLVDAVQLDFGTSNRLHVPAMAAALARLPATMTLAFSAMIVTLLVGFPLGVMAARRPKSLAGRAVSTISLAFQGMPQFWVGIMLVIVFSATLGVLPSSGFTTPQSLVMPAVALALPYIGWLTRSVRNSVMEELDQHYVRTARANGLPARRVFYGHVVRNTLIPVVTVVGLLLGVFIGSAVIVEQVFAWPGVGRVLVEAITYRDYAVVQAAVLVITALYVLMNLAVDLLYSFLDPRVRFGTS